MKNKLFLLLLLCVSSSAFAQLETDSMRAIHFKMTPKYRSMVAGIGSIYLKNTYLSPLSYMGLSMGFSSSTSAYKKWGIYDWAIDGQFDMAGEDLEIMGGQLKFNTYWHFDIFKTNKIYLYAGAGASTDLGVTMNSYSIGYNQTAINGDLNLLPSIMFKYRFKLFHRQYFDFSQQFSTPVLGFGIYPRYSSTFYGPLSENGDSMELGSVFTSLHNCWGLSGRTYIDWRRKDKNGIEYNSFLRVGYLYEGFRLNYDENSYQFSRGLFIVGLVHKF